MTDSNAGTCTIRPANAAEADRLSALAMRSKAWWGYSDEFMAACAGELTYSAAQIDSDRYAFRVCATANELIGFHALDVTNQSEPELEALFVEPAHIGCGFGRALLRHAMEEARSRGATALLIQGDPHAESFYIAAGAISIGSRQSGSIPGRQLPLFRINLTN